ncbi:MAG: 2Fe-2S iron-sulfur cluster-binding protein [Alphaproteobacteria bacterium]
MVQLKEIRPDLSLIEYLRLVERATGTKTSCEEGICGACTVAIGRLRGGELVYEPANACALLVVQLDGCEVVAIEDIADDDGTLHPVQESLTEEHATHCGFCTPGMAMSLFTLHQSTSGALDEDAVRGSIEGNLCRCTGYRSIIAAGVRSGARRKSSRIDRMRDETTKLLLGLVDDQDLMIGGNSQFVAAPTNLDRADSLRSDYPDAVIAGGGSFGTKAHKNDRRIILLTRVAELKRIEQGASELVLGGAVTLADAQTALGAVDPDSGAMIGRIGGPQERSIVTLSDCLMGGRNSAVLGVVLQALGAEMIFLRDGKSKRIDAGSIYDADGAVDSELGQLLVEIRIPRPKAGAVFRAFSVSQRWDLSDAIVAGAFMFDLDDDGKIADAALALAGLSSAPRRSSSAETALIGFDPLDRSVWPAAFSALRADFAADMADRVSARYRAETAQALLGKALIEAGGSSDSRTRMRGFREVHYAAR